MTILLDIIILFVVVEACVIIWRRYARGEASEIPSDLAYLGAGFFLMLAVRVAWTNASALLVILLVTLAGAAHVFDMIRRFRASDSTQKKAPQFGAPVTGSEPKPPY
jgi:chromate transport protein ChrA